ncbi:pentapeptide repeat-containing protein [Fischerella sp. PCC 9605]|uniref:pentapeptide repeat-containing protein n=1 Tax=Fischerella sp. PCC 9605 TaxID=1173024 RepID=UPI0004B95F7A|nr:pentapeptide repeat-containing protein [Fischerella sp. PCC 9605]
MAILIIFLSVIVAHFVAKSSEERVLSFNDFTVIKIFTGIIFSLAIVKASSEVTSFNNKPKPSFLFLKSWAIALSTWGSTCFYNLDLSGVDFTEAIVANTDFRGNKFYRTCLINVKGLDRARVDNRYLDLDNPKVQKLLTEGWCDDCNFSWLNLQGAYLRNAVLRDFNFTETNLNGANLSAADLRDAILVHAQCIDVDFTGANLTGICIQDWSVNSQTRFDNVKCDYIYRKIDDRGKPCDRYPLDRNFEPREFESLYQEVGNVVELVFKEGMNWRAFAFTLQKLQIEDDGLGLQLKGIEKRGDMWVVKVTHNENVPTQEVEKRLNGSYTQLQQLLAAKEQQINRLLGIVENQTEAIKEISKRFGNNFWITGSTITNLSGSGQIEYHEAADQLRKIVANSSDQVQLKATVQNLLAQLQGQNVATTAGTQAELIKQVLLTEAEKDPVFKQLLVLQGQQFADVIPEEAIATAIREAIASLG